MSGGGEPGRGPRFDAAVPPGGYLWWYADGLSDCGRYGVSVIAFVGSVFSPYYAWSGRRDPDDHVCINVALYAPDGNRWTMTERGRASLKRGQDAFRVGASALSWDGDRLTIDFDEVAVPRPPAQWLPRRVKGRIRLALKAVTGTVFDIDAAGRHRWWPIAPSANIDVSFDTGATPDWSGHGYVDCNWGTEPLEQGFRNWTWARGQFADGLPVVIYETVRRDGSSDCLSVVFQGDGSADLRPRPESAVLPGGFWGMRRTGHHDPGFRPQIVQTLEDGPFYMRSVISTQLFGERLNLMHESLSGDRFALPFVKLMLPFRMPRRP